MPSNFYAPVPPAATALSAPRYGRAGRQHGMTLIELMVAMTLGMLVLGVWVLLSNLLPLLSLRIPNSGILLTIVGVVAGVLLLVDR